MGLVSKKLYFNLKSNITRFPLQNSFSQIESGIHFSILFSMHDLWIPRRIYSGITFSFTVTALLISDCFYVSKWIPLMASCSFVNKKSRKEPDLRFTYLLNMVVVLADSTVAVGCCFWSNTAECLSTLTLLNS